MGQAIVERLASEGGSRLLSAWRDSKRRLGRDLFLYHELLAKYAESSTALSAQLRDIGEKHHRALPKEWLFERLNDTADDLAAIVTELVTILRPGSLDSPLFRSYFNARSSRRAVRREAILALYDSELSKLVEQCLVHDMGEIDLVRAISGMYLDEEGRTLYVFLPGYADLAGPVGGFRTSSDPRQCFASRLSIENDLAQIADIALALESGASQVLELRKRVGETLRTTFSIEDLL